MLCHMTLLNNDIAGNQLLCLSGQPIAGGQVYIISVFLSINCLLVGNSAGSLVKESNLLTT